MKKKWLGALVLGQFMWLAAGAQALDSDGDGLPDEWERNGVRKGGLFLDLPAMGADPLHKDIFVQIDFMVASDHTHEPKAEALKKIVACFAAAPVSNPDGTSGINIHLDAGPDTPMKGQQNWEQLSRAQEIPHQDLFGTATPRGGYSFAAQDAVRATNFPAERQGVFHYCLFVHKLGGLGGTSGFAKGIPTDDCIVSLGAWTAQEGTVLEQAGTFIHELGHTLGLRHGGPDHINNKPNYFSVMNYFFQTRGLRVNGRDGLLDFSRAATPALDEYNLNESLGVPGAPAGFGTRWFIVDNGVRRERLANTLTGAIDWNQDGRIDNDVAHDLNADQREQVLSSQDNWSSLVYNGGSIGQRPPGRVEPEEVDDELDLSEDQELTTLNGVSVDSQGNAMADPGSSASLRFRVANVGTVADNYQLSAESEHRWSVSVSPSALALAPGASQEVVVTVALPSATLPGTSDEVELEARSGDLVDSDVEDVVAAGSIPGLNGGASFEGGASGCFVATAAYGSYLDPHVVTLRKFRDHTLLPVAPGVVDFYYRHSPPLARAVAHHGWLRAVALALLTPIVFVLEHPWVSLLLVLAGLTHLRKRPPRGFPGWSLSRAFRRSD